MGDNYAKDPFILRLFYDWKCPSKWVHFQIPDTHVLAFWCWSRPTPHLPEGVGIGANREVFSYI